MPSINLDEPELLIMAEALRVALIADQQYGLVAATSDFDYDAWSADTRRTVQDLCDKLEAVAREHTEAG